MHELFIIGGKKILSIMSQFGNETSNVKLHTLFFACGYCNPFSNERHPPFSFFWTEEPHTEKCETQMMEKRFYTLTRENVHT